MAISAVTVYVFLPECSCAVNSSIISLMYFVLLYARKSAAIIPDALLNKFNESDRYNVFNVYSI